MRTALTISVAGKDLPVDISDETGKFYVTIETPGAGHGSIRLDATSFAELERKARKIKTKFEFPFTRLQADGRVQHGKVTGFHATSGNILVKWDSGDTEQLASWSSHGDVTRRLTDAEAAEVERLTKARNKAQADLNLYLRPLKLDSLKKAAEAERDKAARDA